MRRSTLLLGNSINRVGAKVGWNDVLLKVANSLDFEFPDEQQSPPLTMVFDEATLKTSKSRTDVKAIVASAVKSLRPNPYHREIANLPFRHVLTTNYDFALEHTSREEFRLQDRTAREKYSLFRRYNLNRSDVWHIHGDAKHARSLVIGYDQYMGNTQRLRMYFKTSYHDRVSPFHRPEVDLDFESGKGYSWCDVFLRDDVHVAGLGLTFVEIDLWWVIYYKARMKRRGKPVGKTVYYDFNNGSSNDQKLRVNRALEGLGVEIHTIDVPKRGDYRRAWDKLIKILSKVSRS